MAHSTSNTVSNEFLIELAPELLRSSPRRLAYRPVPSRDLATSRSARASVPPSVRVLNRPPLGSMTAVSERNPEVVPLPYIVSLPIVTITSVALWMLIYKLACGVLSLIS